MQPPDDKPNRLAADNSTGGSPLRQIVLARVREFYREPEALFWSYGFPILMTVALGIAFQNKPIEKIHVDIVDGPTAASTADDLSANAVRAGQFSARVFEKSICEMRLRTGKTDLVVIPAASAPQAFDGGSTEITPAIGFQYDRTRPESVLARNAVDDALQRAGGRRDPVATRDQAMSEPGGRYIDFLIPGLLGMSLMSGGLWGVGFVTVDMRIRKLLKRFLATPMKKRDFLAGIMASRLLFMVPELLIILLFSWLAFNVTIHGNPLLVMLLILLGGVMFAGIGLLVASRAKTIEAVSGLMNLVMLPMWILSGIFFSSARFPEAIQPVLKLLPLTPLIDGLRAVMLDGSNIVVIWPQLAIMAVWAIVSFSLALRWFRWS